MLIQIVRCKDGLLYLRTEEKDYSTWTALEGQSCQHANETLIWLKVLLMKIPRYLIKFLKSRLNCAEELLIT